MYQEMLVIGIVILIAIGLFKLAGEKEERRD